MKTFYHYLPLMWAVVILSVLGFSANAQAPAEGVVPDLTGLGAPRATAELNRVGLRLGEQTSVLWTADSGLQPGTISAQSVAAGTRLNAGDTVDVTVARPATARLLYDDNDLTVINLTDQTLSISGLSFATIEGTSASFNASRWSGIIRPNQCTQVWSVNRNGPKGLPECNAIQNWVTTTNTAQHFWTRVSGALTFEVRLNDSVMATCPAAFPNSENSPESCEFFLPISGQNEVLEFVYFVYTTERFVAVNPTDSGFLRLNRSAIINPLGNVGALGGSFRLSDPAIFGNPDTVADISRLAPDQCLLLKRDDVSAFPLPQACDVVAELNLSVSDVFWLRDFELENVNTRDRYTCTAAVEGRRTICVMPRGD